MSEAVAEATREEIEKIETISSTTTPWGVRLAFGIAGLVLLVGAFVAWQYRGALPASLTDSLPWIIAAAVLLGAGAIMESITTEIWITVIVGIFLVLIAFVVVGRVNVQPQGQALFVVDRFTGDVQYCTADGCRALSRNAEAMIVKASAVPAMPKAMQAMRADEPMNAAAAPAAPAAPAASAASKK